MESHPKWTHKYKLKDGLWVYEPSQESIDLGKQIVNDIKEKWSVPLYYYHLLPGAHVAALKSHIEDNFFVLFDIKRFFHAINKSRITRVLKPFLGYRKARDYAIASTVKQLVEAEPRYALPYGFLQSPLLASIALRYSRLGTILERLHGMERINVSVYMDDIIISSVSIRHLERLTAIVRRAATLSKLNFNDDKQQGPGAVITPFNVHLSHRELEIKLERFEELKSDYLLTDNQYIKDGIAGYVGSINDTQKSELLS